MIAQGWGRIRRGIEAGEQKYSGSSADVLWRRLNSVDFLNQGMIFAGTLPLCAFPFLIVTDALAGQSTARELGRRLGLNRQAAGDVCPAGQGRGCARAARSGPCSP
jgi:membrane protein